MVDGFGEFVVTIYDAAADPSLWPSVLDRLAHRINARGCIVFELREGLEGRAIAAPMVSGQYDPDLLHGYLERFGAQELDDQDHFESLSLATDGIDLIDDAALRASRPRFHRQPNVRLLRTIGIAHRAAGLLDKDNKNQARFSVQRTDAQGPLAGEDRAALNAFLPHVAKALALGRPLQQVAAQHSRLLAAMDRLRIGVCILDRLGRKVIANAEFDRQCQDYGAFRSDPSGRLRLQAASDDAQFGALIADALLHGRFGARPRKEAIVVADDEDTAALCIEVVPLNRSEEIGARPLHGTIVYSLDTSLPFQCDRQRVQRAFALTGAEAELIGPLSDGRSNAEIAAQRDRSVETVKAQVRSILAKTQCANRTQLARLLTNFDSAYRTEAAVHPH